MFRVARQRSDSFVEVSQFYKRFALAPQGQVVVGIDTQHVLEERKCDLVLSFEYVRPSLDRRDETREWVEHIRAAQELVSPREVAHDGEEQAEPVRCAR